MEGGWADCSGEANVGQRRGGWGADGRTGGRAVGLKGPAPRSPLHSRAPKLLASLQSEFAGRLGVHWGPSRGYVILFFCSKQHICNSGTALL